MRFPWLGIVLGCVNGIFGDIVGLSTNEIIVLCLINVIGALFVRDFLDTSN